LPSVTLRTVLVSSRITASLLKNVFDVAPVQLFAVVVSHVALVAPVHVSVAGFPRTSSHTSDGFDPAADRFTVNVCREPVGKLCVRFTLLAVLFVAPVMRS